jgi:methionine-rich copper-binding protein CopC
MNPTIPSAAAARSWTAAAVRALVLTAAVLAGLVLTPAAGWARSGVDATNPVDLSALRTAPAEVDLTLSATPDPDLSHVSVVDGSRRSVGSGDLRRVGDRKLSQPVRITAAGNYTVAYHIEFEDGSDLIGVVRFSVGTGAAPPVPDIAGQRADEAAALQHNHDIDPMSAVLLVVDLAVLVGVVLLLFRRPGRRWTVPPADAD